MSEVNLLQWEKALLPIVISVDGKVTEVNSKQYSKV